jgi:hypothetical protein
VTAPEAVLIAATVIIGFGLLLILRRELADAAERRQAGAWRDVVEVLLPVTATVALLVWAWIY